MIPRKITVVKQGTVCIDKRILALSDKKITVSPRDHILLVICREKGTVLTKKCILVVLAEKQPWRKKNVCWWLETKSAR